MLYYNIIVDTILTIGVIVFWFINSIVNGNDEQDQFLRMFLSSLSILFASIVMYDVGYYNAQADLFYQIDNNKIKEIKKSVDYKKWKLSVQESIEIERKN